MNGEYHGQYVQHTDQHEYYLAGGHYGQRMISIL